MVREEKRYIDSIGLSYVEIRGCGRFLGDRTERFSYVQS